ncbi:S-layer protein [Thermococcus sp. M36]|uniref:S-layer protein n=1 Tax=Thermococcus sp. M36 TaxID=1638261 RepID=UPI00143A31C4|nr:S-layer protein [Thermococcus sp. M36]NJE05861.1 S-layer protein [Thermococcus sp. M36]
MRKILTLLVGLALVGLVIAPVNAAVAGLNSSNTVIVLPTTKIVNGVPVHIGEDAITGSRLGAFLVLQGISQGTYTPTVSVPVEYHSVLIPDSDQVYRLSETDMPDVGLDVGDEPVGKTIVVQVNFSRVGFNSTKKAAEFMDRSIEIVFNENTTPLDVNVEGDYRVVSTTVDGRDVLYFYSYKEKLSAQNSTDEYLVAGEWRLTFKEIDISGERLLVEVKYPDGHKDISVMSKSVYYAMYVDSNGNMVYENLTSFSDIQALLQQGVRNLFVFYITGLFQGALGTQIVQYSYWYYEKIREYHDGDIYSGQWVWDIDPVNSLYILYLHVNESSTDFPEVFVHYGDSLELPMDWGLSLVPAFQKDEDGNIVGIYGYRFVRTVLLKKKVTVVAPRVEVTEDVYSFILEDVQLGSLPSNKNVIIIGGWVSNKAWELLEQTYGAATVEDLKGEIMSRGYVVKELPNPKNPNYKVIILAGKTYAETRKAVNEFMGGP